MDFSPLYIWGSSAKALKCPLQTGRDPLALHSPVCYAGRMSDEPAYLSDPVDWEAIRLTRSLTPGQRIQRMLHARELAAALVRSRLREQFPGLSDREISVTLAEELSNDQPGFPGPWPVPQDAQHP